MFEIRNDIPVRTGYKGIYPFDSIAVGESLVVYFERDGKDCAEKLKTALAKFRIWARNNRVKKQFRTQYHYDENGKIVGRIVWRIE